MNKFPSAKDLIREAEDKNPNSSLNELHAVTYSLMKKYRDIYYQEKLEEFFIRPSLVNLPDKLKQKIKQELIKPLKDGDRSYSNFMEESSRRISQTFQPISGNLAELCVEKELINASLKLNENYLRKKEHTDLIIYYPDVNNFQKKHRIEVKNVKLRERATRGLTFDGDSIIGFFDDPNEFTINNVEIIDAQCKKTSGYCYIPPITLEKIRDKIKNKRFKSNQVFASDMKEFVQRGII